MDKFLKIYNLPTLNHEEIENPNRPTTSKEIESAIKNQSRTDGFTGELYQIFKKLVPLLLKLFPKIDKEESLPNSFYEASITLIPKADKDTTRKKVIGQCPR